MEKICNKQGDKEEFSREKLYRSILNPALEVDYAEEDAEEIADEVTDETIDWMEGLDDKVATSKEIKQKVVELLEDRDEDVAFMYRTHHEIN